MTVRAGVHSTLITQAAKRVLRPQGLFQKGRSRIWLGDHGWWMEVVEFQPGGWSKGSYLNVSCMWLWNVKSYISFDEGSRVADFHRFDDEPQFTVASEMLARQAEERVLRFRTLFPTIRAVSDYYLQKPLTDTSWTAFNAAIAHGLCGRSDIGSELLKRFADRQNHSIEWQKNADLDSRYLASQIHYPEQFRKLILARVLQTRELQKLTSTEDIDFSMADLK